jgi:hypothetical protein
MSPANSFHIFSATLTIECMYWLLTTNALTPGVRYSSTESGFGRS